MEEQKRHSGFEAMRILSMVMIVLMHGIGHGGLCLLAYLAASAAGLFNRMLALRLETALHLNGFVNTVNGYQALATVIASAAMFLLFQNIHIRSDYWRRWGFRLAPLSFGVYLLHDSDFTRALLWQLVDLPRFGGALLPSLAYLTGAVLLIAVAGYGRMPCISGSTACCTCPHWKQSWTP